MTDWTISDPSMRWASERRNHRRIPIEATAAVNLGEEAAPVSCVDLSVGGLLLDSDAPPPLGTRVSIELELEDAVSVKTEAEVVRAEGSRIGLRFLRLQPEALRALLKKIGAS
jgi:hypothetical protein